MHKTFILPVLILITGERGGTEQVPVLHLVAGWDNDTVLRWKEEFLLNQLQFNRPTKVKDI